MTVNRLYQRPVSCYNTSMENDLFTFTFCRADWMRIQQALRAQARDCYTKMTDLGEHGTYYNVLWQEYGYANALADDIDFTLPE